jgi:hypothetical protein
MLVYVDYTWFEEITVKCDLIFMSSKDVLNINSSIICFSQRSKSSYSKYFAHEVRLSKLRTCLIRFVVSKVVLSTARLS